MTELTERKEKQKLLTELRWSLLPTSCECWCVEMKRWGSPAVLWKLCEAWKVISSEKEGPTECWFVLVMKDLFALKTEMWITVPDGCLVIVLPPSTLRRLWNARALDKDECCVFVENFVSRWLVLFQFMLESTNVERGSLSVCATRLTMAVEETGSNTSLDESSRSELFSVTDNQYSLSYICAPSKGFSISVCACANSMRFG